MRTLACQPSHAARADAAERFLLEHQGRGDVVIVAPAQGHAVRLLLRCVTRACGATLSLRSYTPRQLALRLAMPRLAQLMRIPVSALGRHALCSRTVHGLRVGEELGRFAGIADKPGFPAALTGTLDELRRAGLEAADLQGEAPELAALLTGYGEDLRAGGLSDDAEVFGLAGSVLSESKPSGVPLLWFDASANDAATAAFARTLLEHHENALVTCAPLDRDFEQAVVQHVEFARLADSPSPDTALSRLQKHIFSAHTRTAGPDETVVTLSAPGEARECVELARRVLWEAERGTPFEEMAVLSRRGSNYAPHLAEAFRRAGIPVFTTQAAQRPDPRGRALLALLYFREEGYAVRRLCEYLSLQVTPSGSTLKNDDVYPSDPDVYRMDDATRDAGDDEVHEAAGAQPPVRYRAFEQLLLRAAAHGGRQRFEARLAGLHADLRARCDQRRAQGEADESLEQAACDAGHLIDFARPLLQHLENLPQAAAMDTWASALGALARSYLNEPQRVLGVLSELAPLHAGRPLTLRQLIAVLQQPISELRAAPDTEAHGRVFVGSAEEARGLHFSLVCVPGLAEKVFPERVREDPLLLDAVRERLSRALPTRTLRGARERLMLGLCVGAARDKLVLSYPRLDLDRGRPRVPSFYALEALRAAEGALLSYDALMQRAERESATRIGWPAPGAAMDAIDDAEHDLATLAGALQQADDSGVGAARYLLQVNAYLARALRARARRWTVRRFCSADGLVDLSNETKAQLAAYLPRDHAYAVTALERYAECPYRFYLHSIQRLRERPGDEPVDEMSHAHRGTLIHRSMFEALSALKRDGRLPTDATSLQAARAILDAIVSQVAAEERERLSPSVDRVWQDGVERARADLHAWLQRLPDSMPPIHMEYGFGVPPSQDLDTESRADALTLSCGLRLRGAIDLVEGDGSTLRATDHKTGPARTPPNLRMDGGRVLQPLLYGLVLRELFPDAKQVEGRLYYATLRGGFQQRLVRIDESAERAAEILSSALTQAVLQGFFPAAPALHACDHCEYVPVCGPYEQHRTQHKRSELLKPLTLLRKQP